MGLLTVMFSCGSQSLCCSFELEKGIPQSRGPVIKGLSLWATAIPLDQGLLRVLLLRALRCPSWLNLGCLSAHLPLWPHAIWLITLGSSPAGPLYKFYFFIKLLAPRTKEQIYSRNKRKLVITKKK